MRAVDAVVLGVEKKTVAKLQEPRTVKKIVMLDKHVAMTFAGTKLVHCFILQSNHSFSTNLGLHADARVLINKARIECQSYRLTVEDPVSTEYISRHIAGIQQKYTQSGGVRPFGISTLIIGFDTDLSGKKVPRLYQTDPSGIYSLWKVSSLMPYCVDAMNIFFSSITVGKCNRS